MDNGSEGRDSFWCNRCNRVVLRIQPERCQNPLMRCLLNRMLVRDKFIFAQATYLRGRYSASEVNPFSDPTGFISERFFHLPR